MNTPPPVTNRMEPSLGERAADLLMAEIHTRWWTLPDDERWEIDPHTEMRVRMFMSLPYPWTENRVTGGVVACVAKSETQVELVGESVKRSLPRLYALVRRAVEREAERLQALEAKDGELRKTESSRSGQPSQENAQERSPVSSSVRSPASAADPVLNRAMNGVLFEDDVQTFIDDYLSTAAAAPSQQSMPVSLVERVLAPIGRVFAMLSKWFDKRGTR